MIYEIENPCQKCIVRAVCRSICEDARKYLKEVIVMFKPSGSPPPVPDFIAHQIEEILKKPNESRIVGLCYKSDADVTYCKLFIKDSSIIKIEEIFYDNEPDTHNKKPM